MKKGYIKPNLKRRKEKINLLQDLAQGKISLEEMWHFTKTRRCLLKDHTGKLLAVFESYPRSCYAMGKDEIQSLIDKGESMGLSRDEIHYLIQEGGL